MSIRLRLIMAAIISTLVVLLVIGISFMTIQTVQIKGSLYTKIILAKDLLADILPPPEYIIEARLVNYEMLNSNPSNMSELKAKLNTLKKDFMERQAYWNSSDAESIMKKLVTNEIKNSALNYFEMSETKFIPALEKNDKETAQTLLLGELKNLYDQHRQYIDQLVVMANEQA